MKRIIALLCLSIFLSACNEGKIIPKEQYDAYIKQLGFDLPDSLKTPEQRLIKEKMVEVYLSKTEVRNNQMYLTVDRDYFVEQGLPAVCYDIALFEHSQSNKVIKEVNKTYGSVVDLEEVLKEAKAEFLE